MNLFKQSFDVPRSVCARWLAVLGIGGAAYADSSTFSDEAIEYYFRPLVSMMTNALNLIFRIRHPLDKSKT